MTKILALDGLNDIKLCALVEKLLQTIDGVSAARIDFLSQRLTLEIQNREVADVVEDAICILRKAIPNVTVKLENVGRPDFPSSIFPPQTDRSPVFGTESPDRLKKSEKSAATDDPVCFSPPNASDESDEPNPDPKSSRSPDAPTLLTSLIPNQFFAFVGVLLSACFYGASRLTSEWSISLALICISFVCSVASALLLCVDSDAGTIGSAISAILLTGIFFFSRNYVDATAAMLFCQIGASAVFLLRSLVDRSFRKRIDIRPERILCRTGGIPEMLAPESVAPDDIVLTDPGQSISFDGEVVEGQSRVNRFLLTGCSDPIDVSVGDLVYCGDLNQDAPLWTRVLSFQAGAPASRMLDATTPKVLRRNESMRTEKDKILLLSIALIGLSVLMIVLSYLGGAPRQNKWAAALSLLLALSPCGAISALLLAQRAGLAHALADGIAFCSGSAWETLSRVQTVLFGCTDVLTEGCYAVSAIRAEADVSPQHVLESAAFTEGRSTHPIGQAIVNAYEQSGGKLSSARTASCESIPEMGVRGLFDRRVTLVGGERLMREAGVEIPPNETGELCAYVAEYNGYIGTIVLTNALKSGVEALGDALRSLGIDRCALLTGHDQSVADAIKKTLHADIALGERSLSARLQILDEYSAKGRSNTAVYIGSSQKAELFSGACAHIALGSDSLGLMIGLSDAVIPSGNPVLVARCLGISRQIRRALHRNGVLLLSGKLLLIGGVALYGLTLPQVALGNALLSVVLTVNALGGFRNDFAKS